MKRHVEKIAGLIIGLGLLAVLVSVLIVVFGGSLIGLLTVIVGFPTAFPITTTAFVLLALGVFLFRRFK